MMILVTSRLVGYVYLVPWRVDGTAGFSPERLAGSSSKMGS